MTKILYQQDTYLLTHTTRLLQVTLMDPKTVTVVVDETIFHPQGGGQPTDIGCIRSLKSGACMVVDMVKLNNATGLVEHRGKMKDDLILSEGEEVILEVDEPSRKLHARLHSAGHLIHHAIQALGLPLQKTKSYHFPDSPCIECEIIDPNFDKSPVGLSSIQLKIEDLCNKWIAEGHETSITLCQRKDMDDSRLSEKARSSEMVRFIGFNGIPNPRPCGGTHVKNVLDIGKFFIRKVASKGNAIKISYACPC
ncbi:Threonine/alanine tRNA ligase subfamily protein [Paramicrosporidium saccamoebae]|uniref:Threonine/alanine tRNA ligase subfamily protein n=1 Tax=Paramicrosporidium saccamoebae TaxID=1246581 RepID=A0A2H9TIY6_9FUNG|nr:Threonine/alanine tRNA ligase subfamily protein [Paramicrosporidium saccamoebae]